MGSFILAIDTASRCGSIAVAIDGRVAGIWSAETDTRQSSVLWEDVGRLLGRLGLRIGDVTAIAVARGPGAFTGLRIGLAAARGYARATGALVVGATTLELSARSTGAGETVWAVHNAYRNEVYAQPFRVTGDGDPVPLAEPVASPPEVVFSRIGTGPARIVGDGAVLYRELLEAAALRSGVEIAWQRVTGWPGAGAWLVVPPPLALAGDLAELAALRIEWGAASGAVEPCYVRASEAEVNLKAGRLAGAGGPRGV